MLERFRDAKVLVVDDNMANVQLLSTLLARSGLRTVRSALDAQAALDAVRESEPDVILLDLHMPKTDGYAVLERLAIMADVEYLPVLVLTADTTKDAAHRALSLGARDFLTKPFDATEVVLRVRNLLETRFLYKALRQHNVALADELARRLAEEEDRKKARAERYGRIEKVLSDGSLSIVFQPIVDLATRSTVGLEALSRFASEPLRSPDLWFEEALEVGLGPELEMKAVREAVGQLDRIPESSFSPSMCRRSWCCRTNWMSLPTSRFASGLCLSSPRTSRLRTTGRSMIGWRRCVSAGRGSRSMTPGRASPACGTSCCCSPRSSNSTGRSLTVSTAIQRDERWRRPSSRSRKTSTRA